MPYFYGITALNKLVMTPRRANKMKKVIAKRQKNLCVILEDVHDFHNIAAVMRSCDAVGIQEIYLLHSPDLVYCKLPLNFKMSKTSGRVLKWIDLHYFRDRKACFEAVRKKYDYIYTTHLSEGAKSIYDLDLTASVALVFGNERDGVSQEAVDLSDGNFIIPQVGMAQSLNISVACAISVYEAMRQRLQAGQYQTPSFSAIEQAALFDLWKEK